MIESALIFVLVLILVFVTLAGFGMSMHASNKIGHRIVPILVMYLALCLILSTILSNRDITFAGVMIDRVSGEAYWFSSLATKFLNILLAAIAFFGLIDGMIKKSNKSLPKIANPNWLILILIFTLTNGVTCALFGAHKSYSFGLLIPSVIFSFLAIDDRWDKDAVIKSGRDAYLVIIIASFMVLAIKPTMALEQNYNGFLPFVNFRYWGLASHANSLGPIAVGLLLLMYLKPFKKLWLNLIVIAFAITTLALSQSKTTLLASMFVLFVMVLANFIHSKKPEKGLMSWKVTEVIKLFLFIIGFAVLISIFTYWDLNTINVSSSEAQKLSSLSGRTAIWQVAFSEWRASPIFGYGPGLFDIEHRINLGMNFAFHAHNQFIQTLAQSGIVGIIGLICFLAIGAWKSFKLSKVTKGVSIGIFFFILVRCFTEVPLRSGAMFTGEFILLFIWLVILIGYDKRMPNFTGNK
jgi:O-antigen ligase